MGPLLWPAYMGSICTRLVRFWRAIVVFPLLCGLMQSTPVAIAQQSTFSCTEVIGFSQTEQWYDGGFVGSSQNSGAWQLRWFSGGSIDQWAASAGFPGWNSEYLVSHCSQNSSSPDRVVLQISADFHSASWFATQTALAVGNIRAR